MTSPIGLVQAAILSLEGQASAVVPIPPAETVPGAKRKKVPKDTTTLKAARAHILVLEQQLAARGTVAAPAAASFPGAIAAAFEDVFPVGASSFTTSRPSPVVIECRSARQSAAASAPGGGGQPSAKRCRGQCDSRGPFCSACGEPAVDAPAAAAAAMVYAQLPAIDPRLTAVLEAMVARALSAREPAAPAPAVPPRARAPSALEANPTAPGKGSSSQRRAALVAAKAAGAPLPVHEIFIADYVLQTKTAITVSAAVLALVEVLPGLSGPLGKMTSRMSRNPPGAADMLACLQRVVDDLVLLPNAAACLVTGFDDSAVFRVVSEIHVTTDFATAPAVAPRALFQRPSQSEHGWPPNQCRAHKSLDGCRNRECPWAHGPLPARRDMRTGRS